MSENSPFQPIFTIASNNNYVLNSLDNSIKSPIKLQSQTPLFSLISHENRDPLYNQEHFLPY